MPMAAAERLESGAPEIKAAPARTSKRAQARRRAAARCRRAASRRLRGRSGRMRARRRAAARRCLRKWLKQRARRERKARHVGAPKGTPSQGQGQGKGQGPSAPPASGPKPSPTLYLRGVNSYTFAYASTGGAPYRGEPQASYHFLAGRGVELVRLPFYWGPLQPELGGPLDPDYVTGLKAEVERIKTAGLKVVLDLHNSCRWPMYDSPALCGREITRAHVADVWSRLSQLFAGEPAVVAYDLMNEPHHMPNATWEDYSQAMVDAVRATGDRKELWVEGNGYSGVDAFQARHPRAWISDPAGKVTYSAHQYFEYCGCHSKGFDYGGYAEELPSVLPRLKSFTDWLARNRVRGSIGEVGWPSSRRTATWPQWNAKAEEWYRAADAARLPVTYFSATSAYNQSIAAYDAPRNAWAIPGLSVAETQAQVIEAHLSR